MAQDFGKLANTVPASVAVTLEHSERQKSRGLLKLDDGSEAALLLERGTGLLHDANVCSPTTA